MVADNPNLPIPKPSAEWLEQQKAQRKPRRIPNPELVVDDDTLMYPSQMTVRIGLSVNEINALKRKGCKFYGMKTTVNWVRRHLNESTE